MVREMKRFYFLTILLVFLIGFAASADPKTVPRQERPGQWLYVPLYPRPTLSVPKAQQWERCDASGRNCSNIPNATRPYYRIRTADVGHTIRVHERFRNGTFTSTDTPLVYPLS